MKKLFVSLIVLLFVCTACGSKTELMVPTIVEPNLEEIAKAKKEAAKESIQNIMKTANLYYLEQQLNSDYVPHDIIIDFDGGVPSDFVYSGVEPTKGTITIDESGNITINNVVINDLTCNTNEENKVICE